MRQRHGSRDCAGDGLGGGVRDVVDRQDDDVSFDTAASLTDEGFCQHRSQGRFHRVRMNISGTWDFAQGVEIEGQALGRR